MDIKWHGNTCFTIKGKDAKIVINPGKDNGKLKGDIVLSSLKETAKVDGAARILDWPGEYELKDVAITAFQGHTKAPEKEGESGSGDETLIFFVLVDGVRVCHLGDLGHVPSSELINKLGDIHILIINAGSSSNLDKKQALEILEEIDPKAVIAMGEDVSADVLKNLGADKVEAQDKLSIKTHRDLPDDKRLYTVLKKG